MNLIEAFGSAMFDRKVKEVQRELDIKNGKLPPEQSMLDWFKGIAAIPERADRIAETMYPNDARDSSQKNAFRHALGTGLMSQHFGAGSGPVGNVVGPAVGKGAGYLWEALGYALDPQKVANKAYNTDTLHDLNANAIGASLAGKTSDPNVLVNQLRSLVDSSRQQQPPSALSTSPGYLTYTVPPTRR